MMLPSPAEFKDYEPIQPLLSVSASAALAEDKVLRQIVVEIKSHDPSLQTFKYKLYRMECLKIAPLWLYMQASPEGREMFKHHTVWDEKNQTMIILIFDYEGDLISYKRRRFMGGKWITRKSTHPNRQCINGIRSTNGPVYIIEGHHDMLSGLLLHQDEIDAFNFIMIPTVSYTHFCEAELEVLTGRDVFFLPDLGDAGKSVEGMTKLAQQVESFAHNVRVADLKKFLFENDIEVTAEKLDLSDALFLWKDGSANFINTLHYYCSRGIDFDGEAF